MIKKIDFGKKVVFDDKNSDMFLLHKIKSFNLKNIKSVFEELKKWFLITENSDLFL